MERGNGQEPAVGYGVAGENPTDEKYLQNPLKRRERLRNLVGRFRVTDEKGPIKDE